MTHPAGAKRSDHAVAGLLTVLYLVVLVASSTCAGFVPLPMPGQQHHADGPVHSPLCTLACQGQAGEALAPVMLPEALFAPAGIALQTILHPLPHGAPASRRSRAPPL